MKMIISAVRASHDHMPLTGRPSAGLT